MLVLSVLLAAMTPVTATAVAHRQPATPVAYELKRRTAIGQRKAATLPTTLPESLRLSDCRDPFASACQAGRSSDYRVTPASTASASAKDRAVLLDGTDCDVIGQKTCLTKPRTLMTLGGTR